MLILTRRVGESIVVGDDIVLTVFEVRGDAVRVGIEAPRSIQVHRQEVYDELKRLNEQSVSPSDDAVDALREALDPSPVDDRGLSAVPDTAEDADPVDQAQAAAATASAGCDVAESVSRSSSADKAGVGQPSVGTPGAAKSNAGQPNAGKPGAPKPSAVDKPTVSPATSSGPGKPGPPRPGY